MALVDELERGRRTRVLIEELISDPAQLGPDFQPIRRLGERPTRLGELVGWKATGRGKSGTEVGDTLALLETASTLGLVERLDWAFRALAFERAMDAGMAVTLHITPEPETYLTACPPRLAAMFGRGRRALSVAAEIHEDGFADVGRLRSAVHEYREWGWSIVLTDISESSEALRAMSWLQPDIMQIDLSVPGRAESAAVRRTVATAAECGAEVMALGIDTPLRYSEAVQLGATIGRGGMNGTPVSYPSTR